MKRNGYGPSRKWLVLLFCLFPVLSCSPVREIFSPATATPTPTATPTKTPTRTATPTRIPLADRNLKDIALQSSDLPAGFIELDLPDLENLIAQMGDSYSGILNETLETGFASIFVSQDQQSYNNMILVFRDSAFAKIAYDELIDQSQGDEIDVPALGEETAGFDQSGSSTTTYYIVWRYREAVLILQYYGEDEVEVEELIDLAQIIQSRLEEV